MQFSNKNEWIIIFSDHIIIVGCVEIKPPRPKRAIKCKLILAIKHNSIIFHCNFNECGLFDQLNYLVQNDDIEIIKV